MARPDYDRGSLMIVHISPRSYTLPQLFFFYTDISHTLFNFNVSLQFNRRIFHRYSCCLFHLRSFLFSFFFFYILSIPFSLFSQSGSGTRTSNFVRQDKLEISCATKYIYIGNGSTRIYMYIYYMCVCIAGRQRYIRSCRLVIKYPPSWRTGVLGTGYQMARGVASVTLPITNLEIAVPLSAMNWFLVHSWINFASFRVFSSFYRSFSFSFSLLFYRSSSSLSLGWYQFCQLFILIFNIFKNYQKNYLYLYLVTSTKWILLRGSLGNNKGKGWRSIGRIKRETWYSFGWFWKERKGWHGH